MKVLAIEKEVRGTKAGDFMPHLETEALKVWQLYKEGRIREIYFRADETSDVLVLECENIKEAESILSTLPLVPYPGFERLFK